MPQMLVSVFGTPSDLTQVVLKVVQTVVEVGLGPYQWIAAGTADDLRAAWSSRAHEHIVLFGDIPAREIVELLRQADASVIVVLEGPARIVGAVRRTRQLEGLPAIRFASQSLATLHDLALLPRARLLGARDAPRPVDDLVVEIARMFRINLDASSLRTIRQRLDVGELNTERRIRDLIPSDPVDGQSDDELLATEALSGFVPLLGGNRAERFEWRPGLFLGSNPHGAQVTGPLSLVGASRCFLFGPFFHLPAGEWRATVDFEVRENLSGNVLKVDVYTDKVIMEASTRLPEVGRFSFDIAFTIEEPREPMQIRLFNGEGAIEGVFELRSISVMRAN
jgi:hypothetical protein